MQSGEHNLFEAQDRFRRAMIARQSPAERVRQMWALQERAFAVLRLSPEGWN